MRTAIAAVIIAITLPASAKADLFVSSVGPPAPSNSWTQGWSISGSSVDFVGMRIISSTGAFKTPLATDFSDASWSVAGSNGHPYASVFSIGGNLVNSISFVHTYQGVISDPVAWELVAYEGGTYVGSAGVFWTGSTWAVMETDWNPGLEWFNAAPLPAPLAIAGVGLLGVIVTRRRFRAV